MTTTPSVRRQGIALLVTLSALGLAACSGPPTAADGTDVGACGDGVCQVAVSKPVDIAVDAGLGVSTVSVTAVDDDGVNVSCVMGESSGNVGQGSGTVSRLKADGVSLTCGKLKLTITEIADGTAVLELSGG